MKSLASLFFLFLFFGYLLSSLADDAGGDLYAVVYYGPKSNSIDNLMIDRKYQLIVGNVLNAKRLGENNVLTFAYLDILGLPIDFLSEVQENHPEWLLKTKSGKVLKYWYEQNFVCNIGIESFRIYLVNKSKELLKSGYSGVFLDDVSFDLPTWLTSPSDPIVYDEPSYGTWKENVLKLMRDIKEKTSLKIIYNAGWAVPDKDAMKLVDGVMLESFPGSWKGSVNNPNFYYRNWSELHDVATVAKEYVEDKIIIALSYGKENDIDSAIFSFSIARVFGFYYWFSVPALNVISDSPVLSLSLGAPLSQTYNIDGIFYRIFEKGIVAFNPDESAKSINIKVNQLNWSNLYDVKSGEEIKLENGWVNLNIGPISGKVVTVYKFDSPVSHLIFIFSGAVVFLFFILMFLLTPRTKRRSLR